jgi:hypothetical protein
MGVERRIAGWGGRTPDCWHVRSCALPIGPAGHIGPSDPWGSRTVRARLPPAARGLAGVLFISKLVPTTTIIILNFAARQRTFIGNYLQY